MTSHKNRFDEINDHARCEKRWLQQPDRNQQTLADVDEKIQQLAFEQMSRRRDPNSPGVEL